MALHGGNLVTKSNQMDSSQKPVEYISLKPESNELPFGGATNAVSAIPPSHIMPKVSDVHVNSTNRIAPLHTMTKILDVRANGLMSPDGRQHGYPYSNYTAIRPMLPNQYNRGPVQNITISQCTSSAVRPIWPNNSTFRPVMPVNDGTGHSPETQVRVFPNCDATNRVLQQPKVVSSFQPRQALYMVGPKPTTVLNEAGASEHVVKISQSLLPGPVLGNNATLMNSSTIRCNLIEKQTLMKTPKETDVHSPIDGNLIMSSTSLSSFSCSDDLSSSEEKVSEFSTNKQAKSSSSFACTSLNSDLCEVEPSASTTSIKTADGKVNTGSSRFPGDDSSSRELVSSSTAVGDVFGNVADSSTSTVERKPTKKQTNKQKPGVNILGKIAALGMEPDRQQFLENLFAFMEVRGTPITTVPVICRQTVDLYRLYYLVKERSGMVEVSKAKRWRDVSSAIGIGGSTSAGFTLKRNYGRYLFPYECKFDRGDVDPAPLLAAMETPSRKDSRRKAAEREKEAERAIEMEESQSSCSQLTSVGQSVRKSLSGSFAESQNWTGYNVEQICNDARRNNATPVPSSSTFLPSSKLMQSSTTEGYPKAFPNAIGQLPPNEILGTPSMQCIGDAKSEFDDVSQVFGASNGYALHPLQCVQPAVLPNDERELQQNGLVSSASCAEGVLTQNVNENEPRTTAKVGGQLKGERLEETAIGFTSIPQPSSATNREPPSNVVIATYASSLVTNTYPATFVANELQLESGKLSFKGSESKTQGNCVQASLPRPGGGTPGTVAGSTSKGVCLSISDLASTAIEAEASLTGFQHHQDQQPSPALQKNLQFPKAAESAVSCASMSTKSEVHFPPGCVEAKQPVIKRRRLLTHKDLGPVDPWQIMMSLRSGLISESTWALDVLSVLLHDDFTASAFCLSSVPGLLEVLVEYLRRYLIEIFGADKFGDLEVLVPLEKVVSEPDSSKSQLEMDSNKTSENLRKRKVSENAESPRKHNHRLKSASVKSDAKDLGMYDFKFVSSAYDWQMGRGDTTIHVITHFGSDALMFHRRRFFGNNVNVFEREWLESDLSQSDFKVSGSDGNHGVNNSIFTEETTKKEAAGSESAEMIAKDVEAPQAQQLVKVNENDKVSENTQMSLSCGEVTGEKTAEENTERGSTAVDSPAQFDYDDLHLFSCTHLDYFRRLCGEMDEEVCLPDQSLIRCCSEGRTEISKRCLCVSNIIHNLSLIGGNETEMARHRGLLLILSRLLLLHHRHRHIRKKSANNHESTTEDEMVVKSWWWETLTNLRERSLVVLANIAGQLDLSSFPETICLPLLDGLLHWSICQSSEARDQLPGSTASISHLVLEALSKLCVNSANVNLLIATPPFARIVLLLSHLSNLLGAHNPQVIRELSLGLMSRIVQNDNSAARALALERTSVSYLLEFIEGAEHQARVIANTQGIDVLQDYPETIGTSVDMLCRAASVLCHFARLPSNSSVLLRYHQRFLQLVMSPILDYKVTSMLAEVLAILSST